LKIVIENNEKTIYLPKVTLKLLVEGLVLVEFSEKGVFDIEDCFEYELGLVKISEHKSRPILIDLRKVKNGYMTNTARNYIARSEILKSVRKSNAFVVNSVTTKIMVKVYVIINNPGCPAKIFNNFQKAKQWSLQFL
jgi:hypothetical protein